MSNGYSGTPLIKKLGIKPGHIIRIIDEPPQYFQLLGELPEDVCILEDAEALADFIHLFVVERDSFEDAIIKLKDEVKKDGMIWVSWYKKSAKMVTDLDFNVIQQTALSLGLVDVKVCAVDEQWSALKLVWRKELR